MRIAFLQAAAVDESLALTEVAGELLARGHDLRLFLEDQERGLAAALSRWEPELAVVQAAVMAEPWVRRTVERLPSGLPSLLVGTAATFDEELIERTGATWSLQGELDDSLPLLVDCLAGGGDPDLSVVPGLVWRDDAGRIHRQAWAEGPPDLEDRPLPHRDLYYGPYPFMGRFPWKRFATGRGCVHSCGFCYLPGLREGYGGVRPNVRRKSVARLIEEVRAVQASWPLEQIHFADDLFAPSKAWLEELADRFPREVGLPFSCNTSPETVTEKNAELLARAGARVVGIGLETGVEQNRREQLGRRTSDDSIRTAASRLKGRGIQLLTFNMLASPGEGLSDALETLRLNQELGTNFPRVNLAYPFPDSVLEEGMRSLGQQVPAPDTHSRSEWRAWCAPDGEGAPFEILQRLFRLSVRLKLPPSLVARLVQIPERRFFAPLAFYDAWVESRWSGVGVLDTLRYARHAGKPNRRVTYHGSIP
ncbi:MAG: B12-binding domain-containing radical SAM protein [Myxococcota bacterium]|nr:B12-binding domain-containing radical SAM protein [Myxococcota bacterium]